MNQSRRQFVRTLFVASQAAILTPWLSSRARADEAAGGKLNFLLLGDWGRDGEKDQVRVATQMDLAAKKLNANFVISVGDNFYEDGVASVDDPQWQSSFEKVYAAPSLQVPWHAALGNHDYHGDCDAQIAYSKKSRRWTMPARYFQRTEKIDAHNVVDFFFLDTTPMSALDADETKYGGHLKTQNVLVQLAWFTAALAASTAPWKIVIGHHPIYTGGSHGDTPYLVDNILPLLEKHGVQAYFNGHDHDLQHLQTSKVNLFCTGAGSKPRVKVDTTPRTKFAVGCSGFITASLAADKLAVQMIDDQGKNLYAVTVPRQTA